jgi:CBS domain containing-hemolysin-like protein
MTPGPQIRFLDADLPIDQLIEVFRTYRHPRVPVYRGHWDNVIGFLHAEDVLQQLRSVDDVSQIQLSDIVKPAHFVPPTKKVDEMLQYFQRFNTRAAVVIGEYGEVLGIIAIKDVLSFLFGEISGKMRDQEYYQQEDNDSFTVPGYMRLTDLHTLTNFDIDDPLMNTIGGVTLTLFGRLPRVGEKIFYLDYEITVKEVTGTRITKVRVSRGSTASETETTPEASLDIESTADVSPEYRPQPEPKQESLDESEDELERQSRSSVDPDAAAGSEFSVPPVPDTLALETPEMTPSEAEQPQPSRP